MAFASIDDVNTHLPDDKAHAQDEELVNPLIDAARLIRARLTGVFDSSVINTWTTPTNTPEIIREIAGKIAAAKFYSVLVAEDEADGSLYAKGLYDDAIAMLEQIRQGLLTVTDSSGNEIDSNVISETSFWPNDTTVPGPFFTVADVWA